MFLWLSPASSDPYTEYQISFLNKSLSFHAKERKTGPRMHRNSEKSCNYSCLKSLVGILSICTWPCQGHSVQLRCQAPLPCPLRSFTCKSVHKEVTSPGHTGDCSGVFLSFWSLQPSHFQGTQAVAHSFPLGLGHQSPPKKGKIVSSFLVVQLCVPDTG